MLPAGAPGSVVPILVGGHESAHGANLTFLLDALPRAVITPPGRALHEAVSTLLTQAEQTALVLPMTWGRDPRMIADTAKTLAWLAHRSGAEERLALCAPFGTADHLVAWLRRAATATSRQHPGAAIIVTAPSADPFDDADLHRVAHLVRSHGAGVPVEVACLARPAELADAVSRARLLGYDDVVVVPAGFARTAPSDLPTGVTFFGPLLSERAVVDVVHRRLRDARHDLGHGHHGIAAGLTADHDHGYAHTHGSDGHPHHHPHEALTAPH